jgi:hypothetical protein
MSDYTMFRFREINKHLLASLVNSEIYFAQPNCLNDPFDCRVEVLKSLDNAISKSSPENRETLLKLRQMQDFFEKVQADVSQVGVSSFSLDLNNPLMWSHYADQHRGVSLMYNFPETYFHDNKDRILGIDQVEYDVNPLTNWFLRRASSLGTFEEFGIALICKILTIKSKPWEYEGEVRILRRTHGLESLDRKYLRQVCFGLETPKADVELVSNILKHGQYDITLCRMVRCCETDFGLKPEEI